MGVEDSGSRHGSLPAQLTAFVGREADLVAARARLGANRLVTVTGPGGVGKTRLALELARRWPSDGAEEVWFVDLSSTTADDSVAETVAAALDVPDSGDGPADGLARHLVDRNGLLLLDNCEQVTPGASELVGLLLRACPGLRVLATSREPLRADGEALWTLAPMAVPPEPGADVDTLMTFDAVKLFVARARGVDPGFRLGPGLGEDVATICRALDGVPLALELAAARVRALGPDGIRAALADRFGLLQGGPREAPARRRSLRASIQWSVDVLEPGQLALFQSLSIFSGTFDLSAVQSVCVDPGLDDSDLPFLLSDLVDRSLVQVERVDGRTRYRLLVSVKELAGERLAERGDLDGIRTRHFAHYMATARRLLESLAAGNQVLDVLSQLDLERENVLAALRGALDGGQLERGAALVSWLRSYWVIRGRYREGRRWAGVYRDASRGRDPRLQVRSLLVLTSMTQYQGELVESVSLGREALELAEQSGSARLEGQVLRNLGWPLGLLDPAAGIDTLAKAGAKLEEARDHSSLLEALLAQGTLVQIHQTQRAGADIFRRGIAVASEVSDEVGALPLRVQLGLSQAQLGELASAMESLEAAVAALQRVGYPYWEGFGRLDLALVHLLRGQSSRAAEEWQKAGALAEAVGNPLLSGMSELNRWLLLCAGAEGVDAAVVPWDPRARSTLGPWSSAYIAGGIAAARSRLALRGGHATAARDVLDGPLSCLDEAPPFAAGLLTTVAAEVARGHGELDRALDWGRAAVGHFAGNETVVMVPEAVDGLSATYLVAGDTVRAARLAGAAAGMRQRMGTRALGLAADPWTEGDTVPWEQGRGLEADEVIAWILRDRPSRGRPPDGWASLTPAELSVVKLVAEGLSNPEVAARLFVSRRTVSTHLSHVFAKLGISSRSELAAAAVREGIQA